MWGICWVWDLIPRIRLSGASAFTLCLLYVHFSPHRVFLVSGMDASRDGRCREVTVWRKIVILGRRENIWRMLELPRYLGAWGREVTWLLAAHVTYKEFCSTFRLRAISTIAGTLEYSMASMNRIFIISLYNLQCRGFATPHITRRSST